MLSIKFRRIGKKHQASFRVMVAEARSKMTGHCVEDLGWLNPRSKKYELNKERAVYWLKNGARPTDSVYNLLVKSGTIKGKKKPVHARQAKTETVKEPAVQAKQTVVAKAE